MLHINLHILYIYFFQIESEFERISRVQQLHQRLSRKQDKIMDELYSN